MMWNHGAGLDGSNYDDSDGTTTDNLKVSEMVSALTASGVPSFSLVGYDACLMGMYEVGYQLRNLAPVYVSSQELEGGDGHDYNTLLNILVTNPQNVTPEQLANAMVTSYGNQYVGTGVAEDTYSSVRTSNYAALSTAVKAFVTASNSATSAEITALKSARDTATKYDTADYKDMGSFFTKVKNNTSISTTIRNAANAVLTQLSAAVTSKTNDGRASSGISIYLPSGGMQSNYTTEYAAFNTATNWSTFINKLTSGARPGSTGTGGSGRADRTMEAVDFSTAGVTPRVELAPPAATGSLRERFAALSDRIDQIDAPAKSETPATTTVKSDATPAKSDSFIGRNGYFFEANS
jgi:hypothetical protein